MKCGNSEEDAPLIRNECSYSSGPRARSLLLMSERDARGPEDDDKPSFILGGSVSSLVENWSGAPIGANFGFNLTLKSGAKRRISKGGNTTDVAKSACFAIFCAAHPSRRPLRGLLRMRVMLVRQPKLAPMSGAPQPRA
jgi:hypothetical protein